MAEKGGVNLYGFVWNNPVSLIDSDGRLVPLAALYWECAILFGAGATWYATRPDTPDINLPDFDSQPFEDAWDG